MLRIFLSVIIFSYLYSACCKVLGEQYVGYYFHNQSYWSSYRCYLLDSFITLMVWFMGHSFCRCGITWQNLGFWITGLNGIVWDLEMHFHAICWCKDKLLCLVTFMDRGTAYVALQVLKYSRAIHHNITF